MPHKQRALAKEPLQAVLDTCDDSLKGKHDRALLLFGWSSGGRRRSEVAGASFENLRRADGPIVGMAAGAMEEGALGDAAGLEPGVTAVVSPFLVPSSAMRRVTMYEDDAKAQSFEARVDPSVDAPPKDRLARPSYGYFLLDSKAAKTTTHIGTTALGVRARVTEHMREQFGIVVLNRVTADLNKLQVGLNVAPEVAKHMIDKLRWRFHGTNP